MCENPQKTQENPQNFLQIELNLSQLSSIAPLLGSESLFELKIPVFSQKSLELLHEAIEKHQIRLISSSKNQTFPSNSHNFLDPELSILEKSGQIQENFLENLTEKSEKAFSDYETEEKKENFPTQPAEILEKTLENLDKKALFYLKSKGKIEEILENFEEKSLKISLLSTSSLQITGEKADVLKFERIFRRLLGNILCEELQSPDFSSFSSIEKFIKQDFFEEIVADFGVKSLEIDHEKLPNDLKPVFPRNCLLLFVEDRGRVQDLRDAVEKIKGFRRFSVNIAKVLSENLSNDEKKLMKSRVLKAKYEYISRFLVDVFKEKAEENELVFKEIRLENEKVQICVEGEASNKQFFENDVKLLLRNLRTLTKKSRFTVKKQFFSREIAKNLENLETSLGNLQNQSPDFPFPLQLHVKFLENSSAVVATLVGFVENLEKFEEFGESLQKLLDFTEKTLEIRGHSLRTRLNQYDFLKDLEKKHDLKLNFSSKTGNLHAIGGPISLESLESFINFEELSSERQKMQFSFKDSLNFSIFSRYEAENLVRKLAKIHAEVEEIALKRETKQIEFLTHPKSREKVFAELEDCEKNIRRNIAMKFVHYSGKNRYFSLNDAKFVRKTLGFEEKTAIPVELVASSAEVEKIRQQISSKKPAKPHNCSGFLYKNKIEVEVFDSVFPEEISLDGLVVNMDLKGNFIDKHSRQIAETSETNRLVAKEINKLNDNNMSKKKRAEVSSFVECRNPTKTYKIAKMFYSLIKTNRNCDKDVIKNCNDDVYSMCLDYKTKKIVIDHAKFTYQRNLAAILRTSLDDEYKSLGFIVTSQEIDVLIGNIEEFCKNNVDFTVLNKICVFTNNNEEATYINNAFAKTFDRIQEKPEENSMEMKSFPQNSQNNGKRKEIKWKFFQKNRKVDLNANENKIINQASEKKIAEVWLIQKLRQGVQSSEIYININNKKITDLSNYKQQNYYNYLAENPFLKKLVENYKEIGIPTATFYEENTVFFRLDLNKMAVEQFSTEVSQFELVKEEIQQQPQINFIEELEKAEENKENFCYILYGYPDDIEEAQIRINEEFNKEKISEEFIFPKTIEEKDIEEIIKIIQGKFDLQLKREDFKVSMLGIKSEINEAKALLINEITSKFDEILQNKSQIKFPVDWESQEGYFKKVVLKENSQEYGFVQGKFHLTMQKAMFKITSIKRIQNKNLFIQYSRSISQMKDTDKKQLNEKFLFHGSRNTNPKEIYEGKDVGFDMRLANEGLWGNAIYFAENASYSHKYAFQPAKKGKITRKIILAKVLLGECVLKPWEEECKKLKRPPFKNRKGNEMYDSVEGFAEESQIYMIYDNYRAYPAYEINYC